MSLSPFIRTPFTDISGSLINHQLFGECAKMELEAVECLEAYGLIRGSKKCADIIDDFNECQNSFKQIKRSIYMMQERKKQIKEGKLKGNEKYGQTPIPGSL